MRGYGRARRDGFEILLNLRARRRRIDVAGDRNHRVRRPIICLEPLLNVFERGGIQILHGADDGP
jgi:hypothetical protein